MPSSPTRTARANHYMTVTLCSWGSIVDDGNYCTGSSLRCANVQEVAYFCHRRGSFAGIGNWLEHRDLHTRGSDPVPLAAGQGSPAACVAEGPRSALWQ